MNTIDLLVRDTLEGQVPLRLDRQPEWEDVLARAGVASSRAAVPTLARRRRRRPRLLIAVALIVITAIVAGSALAALGHNPFSGLTSWLDDSQGTLASDAEQAGFAARNDASYAAFPRNTRLRLLLRESVGDQMFSLLGFRNGSSLCLRLVRTNLPDGAGANQCVTLRELHHSSAPALVASQASFRFGTPETAIAGILGFADDTVRAIDLRRQHGARQTVQVVDNVFLALSVRPSEKPSMRHPPGDPIVEVRALTRSGRVVAVPFAGDSGQLLSGPVQGPSYLRQPRVKANQLPGPATATAQPPGGTPALLSSREPPGRPFAIPGVLSSLFGKTVFARSIQPDPDSPFRVGISLTNGPPRPVSGAAGLFTNSLTLRPNRLTLCVSGLRVLAGIGSMSCAQPADTGSFFPSGQPVTVAGFSNEQLVRLYGIAADSVREIDLYLASGRVIPAALRDNAYTVEAPAAQLPGKLVGYDAERHPIWVHVPNRLTPPILTPCPPATVARRTSLPKPYERLDLATAKINGDPIFGRSPVEVEAALGPPDWRRPERITPTTRDHELVYGSKQLADAALVVRFVRRQHRLRAVILAYRGPGLVDARLGHLLHVQPSELQRRVAATYGSTYRRVVAYGSEPSGLGCGAEFRARHGLVGLSFGLQPWLSSRPYLLLRHP